MALPDVEVAAAFQDDEKVYLKIGPGVDAKGMPAKWRSVPTLGVSDPSVVTVDQTSNDPDGNPQSQTVNGISGWLVGGAPGTADVTAALEVDANQGADQNVIIHCAVGGGDSTGAAVVLGDPVKQ